MTEREYKRKEVLDFHALEHQFRQGKLSFASEERMLRCLGVRPGSVCAFALIHDIAPESPDPKELFENGHRVKYYIDKDLLKAPKVSFHPCENTASVVIHLLTGEPRIAFQRLLR